MVRLEKVEKEVGECGVDGALDEKRGGLRLGVMAVDDVVTAVVAALSVDAI